jgi:RNA polymerase sigma-70 factor (ECF subfamily)
MNGAAFACALTAWQKHHAEVKGYLVRRVPDPGVAEDLLQEVFLKAMRQGQAFCELDNARAWLFQVARNAWVDHVRLDKGTVPLPEDLVDEKESMAPVDELAGCVERTLSALSPEDGDVIRQCDLDGVTLKSYADANGLTLPAVKSRIQRARRRMRDRMVENCQVRFDDAGQVCCHVPRPAA